MFWEKHFTFSIRKLAVGVASVTIGAFFVMASGSPVSAEQQVKQPSNVQLQSAAATFSVTYQYVDIADLTQDEKASIQTHIEQLTADEDEQYYIVYRPQDTATASRLPETGSGNHLSYLLTGIGVSFLVLVAVRDRRKKSLPPTLMAGLIIGNSLLALTPAFTMQVEALTPDKITAQTTYQLTSGEQLPMPYLKDKIIIGYLPKAKQLTIKPLATATLENNSSDNGEKVQTDAPELEDKASKVSAEEAGKTIVTPVANSETPVSPTPSGPADEPVSDPETPISEPVSEPVSKPTVPVEEPVPSPETPVSPTPTVPANDLALEPTSPSPSEPTVPSDDSVSNPETPISEPVSEPVSEPTVPESPAPTIPVEEPVPSPETPVSPTPSVPADEPVSNPEPPISEPVNEPVSEPTAPVDEPKTEIDESLLDPDNDGLTNAQEQSLGTDNTLFDTDGDGISDGEEASAGSNPLNALSTPTDLDGDGFTNDQETIAGSNSSDSTSTPKTVLDKSRLSEAIARAKGLIASRYTTASYGLLEPHLTSADVALSTIVESQETIDQATQALNDVLNQLVPLKQEPILSYQMVSTDDIAKTLTTSYRKEDADNAITSIITNIYDPSGQLVASVSGMDLSAVVLKLDYDIAYTVKTTYSYDLGNGVESKEITYPKPIELTLKKVVFRDIDNATIYVKNTDGIYVPKTDFATIPNQLNRLFIKIDSDQLGQSYLPISEIKEVLKENQPFFDVVVALPQLVQSKEDGMYQENLHMLIPKAASGNNIYNSFASLLKAMIANPSGTFMIGTDLDADDSLGLLEQGTYVPKIFKGTLTSALGKTYSIKNLKLPLFEILDGASISNINLTSADIKSKPNRTAATLALTAMNNTYIEKVAVEGSVTSASHAGGLLVKLDNSTVSDVLFKGAVTSTSTGSLNVGGLVGEVTNDAHIISSHADITVTVSTSNRNARVGGLVGLMTNTFLYDGISSSYAEGTVTNDRPNTKAQVGGLIGSTYRNGSASDLVSAVKVTNGNLIYGDGDYVTHSGLTQIVTTPEASSTKADLQPITAVNEVEAKAKLDSFDFTAAVNKPITSLASDQDYLSLKNAEANRKRAYENTAKLLPFYNKETIVRYGNKIATNDKLYTTDLISVTPMVNNRIATDITKDKDLINMLMLHYADYTVEYRHLTSEKDFTENIAEYQLGDNLLYTPSHFLKNTDLVTKAAEILKTVDYYSVETADALAAYNRKDIDNYKNSKEGKGATDDVATAAVAKSKMAALYLDREVESIKKDINGIVGKLLTQDAAINNQSGASQDYILSYIKKNKVAIMLGMAYMQRWYNLDFDLINIQDLASFQLDFFGQKLSTLDFFVKLADQGYQNLRAVNNPTTYKAVISPVTGLSDLQAYIAENRQLFTKEATNEDWFLKTTKAYVVETPSKEWPSADYKFYNRMVATNEKMLLPLATLEDKGIFIISNIVGFTFGMYSRYMNLDIKDSNPDTYAAKLKEVEAKVKQSADWQGTYFDTWYRILDDEHKKNLQRTLLTYDGYLAKKTGPNVQEMTVWLSRDNTSGVTSNEVLDFFGPMDKYYGNNGTGAYATGSSTHFVYNGVLTSYGLSVFSHETTHNLDGSTYLGYGRRSGKGAEAFAMGLLQVPYLGTSDTFGINLIFDYPQNDQNYQNASPSRFKNAADLQEYYSRVFDVLYTLDYAEGKAVVELGKDAQKRWFNQIKSSKDANGHAIDTIAPLSDAEWDTITLNNFNDLIDNHLITVRDNAPRTIGYNGYYTVNMFSPSYGTTTQGSEPGDFIFRRNAFELLAANGYYDGFVPYTSNKLNAAAKSAGSALTDDFIVNNITGGKYTTMADYHKALYQERIDAVARLKKATVIMKNDVKTINNFADLEHLMKEAVQTDLDKGTISGSYSRVKALKKAIFNAYLTDTEDFKRPVYSVPFVPPTFPEA